MSKSVLIPFGLTFHNRSFRELVTYDLTRAMGLNQRELPRSDSNKEWAGLELFRGLNSADLHNGLTIDETRRLAETFHVDEAITLILRDLMKVLGRRRRQRRKD